MRYIRTPWPLSLAERFFTAKSSGRQQNQLISGRSPHVALGTSRIPRRRDVVGNQQGWGLQGYAGQQKLVSPGPHLSEGVSTCYGYYGKEEVSTLPKYPHTYLFSRLSKRHELMFCFILFEEQSRVDTRRSGALSYTSAWPTQTLSPRSS